MEHIHVSISSHLQSLIQRGGSRLGTDMRVTLAPDIEPSNIVLAVHVGAVKSGVPVVEYSVAILGTSCKEMV